nr:GntR family transcriptional regulator [uncultured Albidiferax sp.]
MQASHIIDMDLPLEGLRGDIANAGKGLLYEKLAEALRSAISGGRFRIGQTIPAERELAEKLGMSRVTVRRAIETLVGEGLLTVRRGAGAYVSPRIQQPLLHFVGFTEDMRRRGYVPGSRWLSRKIGSPSPDDLVSLALQSTDSVVRVVRVRTADGEPLAIESAVVNAAFVGGEAEFGDSLYAAIGRHGIRPFRALQRLRARLVTTEEAELLNVGVGEAVLAIERRSFTQEGLPVEFTQSVYRGDLYDYVAELSAIRKSEGAA